MAKTTPDSITRNPKRKYNIFRSLRFGRLDSERREILDPTPMQPPIGYTRRPSLADQIRDAVRNEKLAQELAAQGVETFEEADDFDIPDDPIDPTTPYEGDFEGDAGNALLEVHNTEQARLREQRDYGSVEEYLRAHPEQDPRLRPQGGQGAQPGAAGAGGGLDAPKAAHTPDSPAQAGHGNPFGFFRRG